MVRKKMIFESRHNQNFEYQAPLKNSFGLVILKFQFWRSTNQAKTQSFIFNSSNTNQNIFVKMHHYLNCFGHEILARIIWAQNLH